MILSLASYCTCSLKCRRNPGQTIKKNHNFKKKKRKRCMKRTFFLIRHCLSRVYVGGWCVCTRKRERHTKRQSPSCFHWSSCPLTKRDEQGTQWTLRNSLSLTLFHIELYFCFILLGASWFLTITNTSFFSNVAIINALFILITNKLTKSESTHKAKRCY